MSSVDRRPYLSASVLNQALLDACADNFETKLEMIVDIERPDGGYIRASDRNKYVGGIFYEALLVFPVTSRTVGEWLSPTLQFSSVELELSNADGRFNDLLPGGSHYDAFIGRQITVSIGLAESSPTYSPIFSGTVTAIGGVSRGRYSITFIARDRYEKLNTSFPKIALTRDAYPLLEEGNIGRILPVIYGDWTVALEPDLASVPAICVNGGATAVNGGTEDAPDSTRSNIKFVISENSLTYFDVNNVYVLRSDVYYRVDTADVTALTGDNRTFEIIQNSGHTVILDENLLYSQGDAFFVRVKGKDLGAYSNNPVAQAKDILLTQAGANTLEFESNWDYFRDKSSPPESAIALIPSRICCIEERSSLEYALSLLEQIRLEAFIDKNLKIKINSLHFEDFPVAPTFQAKNWDIIEDSLEVMIDDQHNFNRAQGTYDYRPNRNEESRSTRFVRNNAAIAQVGQEISKRLVYPNLYVQSDVENQIKETIKISSSLFETVNCSMTWRALLLDVGDFITLQLQIGSIVYTDIPAMIRTKGQDAEGIKIPMTLWSFQLLPYPGFEPGYNGTVGGYSAVINFE